MNKARIDTKLVTFVSWTLAVVIALLPFHAFFTSWAANNFGHLDFFRLWKEYIFIIIFIPVIYLGIKCRPSREFLKKSWIVRLFILYILLHIILAVWALDKHNVNKTAVAYSFIVNLRFIGFFIMTYIVASSSGFLKRNAGKLVVIPALIVIAAGLLQKLTMSHNLLGYFYGRGTIPPYQTVDGDNNLKRVQSTLRGANPLGAYLVLAFTAIAALVKNRIVRDLSLVVGLVVIFYSYSRSAWLGAIISLWLLAWWMLLKKHHRTWLIASVFVIIIMAGALFYLFKSQPAAQDTLLHTSSNSKSSISSNEARRIALKSGVHDVINQPLGGGPGSAGPASYRNKPHHTRIAENYYLQIGQEVGVLGMAVFIAINILVAKELWRVRNDILSRVLLASLAGISFINLISHAWTDDTLSLLWWGLAGICLAPAIIADGNKQNKNAEKNQKRTAQTSHPIR